MRYQHSPFLSTWLEASPSFPHGPESKWVVEQTHYNSLFPPGGKSIPCLEDTGVADWKRTSVWLMRIRVHLQVWLWVYIEGWFSVYEYLNRWVAQHAAERACVGSKAHGRTTGHRQPMDKHVCQKWKDIAGQGICSEEQVKNCANFCLPLNLAHPIASLWHDSIQLMEGEAANSPYLLGGIRWRCLHRLGAQKWGRPWVDLTSKWAEWELREMTL